MADEKKKDREEDREFKKERRGCQEAERTSLHSLLIRAVIGQKHDTHTCAGTHACCGADCAYIKTKDVMVLWQHLCIKG